jgi:hypothetical protein
MKEWWSPNGPILLRVGHDLANAGTGCNSGLNDSIAPVISSISDLH